LFENYHQKKPINKKGSNDMRKSMIFTLVVVIGFCLTGYSFAVDEPVSGMQQTSKYGISLALAVVPFVGGDSGPTTPISATDYKDTFDTGYGGRIEIFYDLVNGWRFYLGGVYNKWEGQFFQGGEFPNGAKFDDFSMAGFYIGVKYRFNREARIRPYLLGNLGLVSLSSVDVTVNGNKIPYWDQTYRDYLDLGAGIEYGLTNKVTLFLDIRLEAFGKPDSANFPIAEATGGQTLPITFGIDYRF
jgi:hypothetical protein